MREVTLYSVNPKKVIAYGHSIPFHVMTMPRRYILGHDEFLNADECRHVDHLPIEHFNDGLKDYFVAFEPLLQDIIDYKIHSAAQVSTAKAMEVWRDAKKDLECEIKSLQTWTIWDMIKLKFKRRTK